MDLEAANSQSQMCTNFGKMEMCKVTDKPTDTVTLTCLFFYISRHHSIGN